MDSTATFSLGVLFSGYQMSIFHQSTIVGKRSRSGQERYEVNQLSGSNIWRKRKNAFLLLIKKEKKRSECVAFQKRISYIPNLLTFPSGTFQLTSKQLFCAFLLLRWAHSSKGGFSVSYFRVASNLSFWFSRMWISITALMVTCAGKTHSFDLPYLHLIFFYVRSIPVWG